METINNSLKSQESKKPFRIETYEVKSSRNNFKVPVVNDVHLHSIYNPTKEAQALISNYDENLQTKNLVLVFGLGFAYHVHELCRKLESYHGNNYQVVVIEPNEQVHRDCISNNLFPNKNIKVYTGFDLENIFGDVSLVRFLTKKPLIIQHPPTFNLYVSFFKNFLDFTAKTDVTSISKFVTDKSLREYLLSSKSDNNQTFNDFMTENILGKNNLNNELDHMLLAYTYLSNGEF